MTRRTRPTRSRTASRSLQTGTRTSLGLPLEDRLILVAQGIEFHNSDLEVESTKWMIPRALWDEPDNSNQELKIPGLARIDDSNARYTNQAQRVRYHIKVITSKQQFHAYLEGREGRATYGNNVMVMYDGHARYGRGPCLGSSKAPGNHWGTGDDPRNEGIFRIGYPYLYVPSTEILHHQYEAVVAREQTSDPSLSRVDLRRVDRNTHIHPHLRSHLGARSSLRGYSLADLDAMEQQLQRDVHDAVQRHGTLRTTPESELRGTVSDVLHNRSGGRNGFARFVAGATGARERLWAFHKDKRLTVWYKEGGSWYSERLSNPNRRNGRFRVPQLVLHADWQNTTSGTWQPSAADPSARMDLGATHVNCRAFCHFGCSTLVHNYRVMRTMKRWTRSSDRNDRLCYWTTESAYGDIGPYWIYHVLTYIPGRSRGFGTRSWGDVLRYARRRTNDDLALDRRNYRVR